MGISLSVHYLNNQHPSKIRHSISRSMYHSSLEEITKILTLEKTKNNHSEMAFNLKWFVIFTLAMVGQLLDFGSAMPQSTRSHSTSTASSVDESTKDPDMSEADMKITPEMLEKAFERLDENENNFISKREFFQGVESFNEDTNDPKEDYRDTLNVLFNELDKNNDGKLDIEEFKKFGSSRRVVGAIFASGAFLGFLAGLAVG